MRNMPGSKFFVFADEGYDGARLMSFDDEPAALAWIEGQIAASPTDRKLEHYRLIQGHESRLGVLEVVKKIKAD